LGPTQPLVQCIPGALSILKQLGREAELSPPPRSKVKNAGTIPPLPKSSPQCGDSFIEYRGCFTFHWPGSECPLLCVYLNITSKIRSMKKQHRRAMMKCNRYVSNERSQF
jgi:hypothetical protein